MSLPPLTMIGNNNETFIGENNEEPGYMFSRIGRDNAESISGMLPYLGLKERKPYPDHIGFDQNDPLGSTVSDKVTELKRSGNLVQFIYFFKR